MQADGRAGGFAVMPDQPPGFPAPTTAGVSTTASAKLNSSARVFATPSSSPREIVAPEREKPRNGRHKPWIAPMARLSRFVSVLARGLFPGAQAGPEDQHADRGESGRR